MFDRIHHHSDWNHSQSACDKLQKFVSPISLCPSFEIVIQALLFHNKVFSFLGKCQMRWHITLQPHCIIFYQGVYGISLSWIYHFLETGEAYCVSMCWGGFWHGLGKLITKKTGKKYLVACFLIVMRGL